MIAIMVLIVYLMPVYGGELGGNITFYMDAECLGIVDAWVAPDPIHCGRAMGIRVAVLDPEPQCSVAISTYRSACGIDVLSTQCIDRCSRMHGDAVQGHPVYARYDALAVPGTDASLDETIIVAVTVSCSIAVVLVTLVLGLVVRKLKQRDDYIAIITRELGLRDDCLIGLSDLEIGDGSLGAGAFGNVRSGVVRGTTVVAVKEMQTGKDGGNANGQLMDEARVMARLPPHPNVVQFLGICIDESKSVFYIVTQYMANRSVQWYFKHLRERRKVLLPQHERVSVMRGIAAGMDHLSHYGIVHNDLAARNVLADVTVTPSDNGDERVIVPKITDFGLSSIRSDGRDRAGTMLPVRWTAPEVIRDPSSASSMSDAWSYGITMFEVDCMCSRMPYEGMDNGDVRDYVVAERRIMERPQWMSQAVYDTMAACLSHDPYQRPSFRDIYTSLGGMLSDGAIASEAMVTAEDTTIYFMDQRSCQAPSLYNMYETLA